MDADQSKCLDMRTSDIYPRTKKVVSNNISQGRRERRGGPDISTISRRSSSRWKVCHHIGKVVDHSMCSVCDQIECLHSRILNSYECPLCACHKIKYPSKSVIELFLHHCMLSYRRKILRHHNHTHHRAKYPQRRVILGLFVGMAIRCHRPKNVYHTKKIPFKVCNRTCSSTLYALFSSANSSSS